MFKLFCKTVRESGCIRPGERVTVALSGGADSVCLLYLCSMLMNELPFSLSAAHVNHGLRAEAETEAAFCRRICSEWNIPLYETKVDVTQTAREQGISLETAGRMLRYRFFETLDQDKIALAHHKNDQAETVLMHLLRGSGAEGLGGMAPVRGNLIRPLLNVTKQEIEEFCIENKLVFCTDQSNFSRNYHRNKIRLDVLPLLEQMQPGAVNALARTADLLREDELQLKQDAQKAFQQLFHSFEDGFYCDRSAFFALSRSLQRRTLRLCWEEMTGKESDLWFHQVETALELFWQGKTGKKCYLGQQIWAENSYGELIVAWQREPVPFCFALREGERVQPPGLEVCFTAVRGKAEPEIENTWIFDYNRVKTGINIRSRREGDIFCLNGRKQKLKKLFIDRKIPRRARDRAAVAECQGEIIAVTGLGVAKAFRGSGEDCLIVKQERVKNK